MSEPTLIFRDPATGQRVSVPESLKDQAIAMGGQLEDPGAFEAARVGAAEGLTFGLSGELAAGWNTLTNFLGDPKGEAKGEVKRGLQGEAPTYEERAQGEENRIAQAYAAQPGAAYAADVGTSLLMPLGAAKVAKAAGKGGLALRAAPKMLQAAEWTGPAGTRSLAAGGREGLKALARRQATVAPVMALEGAGRTPGGLAEKATGAAAMTGLGVAGDPVMRGMAGLAKRATPIARTAIGAPVGAYALGSVGDAVASLQPKPEGATESDDPRIGKGGSWEVVGGLLGAAAGFSPRKALQMWARIRGSSAAGDVGADMAKYLDLSPEGKALRQAAHSGDQRAQEIVTELTDKITTVEKLGDEVRTYHNTGYKPEAVRQMMVGDTVEQGGGGFKQADWTPPKTSALDAAAEGLLDDAPVNPMPFEDLTSKYGVSPEDASALTRAGLTPTRIAAMSKTNPSGLRSRADVARAEMPAGPAHDYDAIAKYTDSTPSKVRELMEEGMTLDDLAMELGLSAKRTAALKRRFPEANISPVTPIAEVTQARTPQAMATPPAIAREERVIGAPPSEGTDPGFAPPLGYDPYPFPPVERSRMTAAATELPPVAGSYPEIVIEEGTQPRWRPSPGVPVSSGESPFVSVGANPARYEDLTPLGGYGVKAPPPRQAPDIPVETRMREERIVGTPPPPESTSTPAMPPPNMNLPLPPSGEEQAVRARLTADMGRAHAAGVQVTDELESLASGMKDFKLAWGRKLGDTVERLRATLGDAPREGGAGTKEYIFTALDQAKRELGNVQTRLAAARNDSNANAFEKEAAAYYEEKLRPLLEDESLWGKEVAGMQRDINPKWYDWIATRPGYQKAFLSDMAGEHAADPFRRLAEADPKKIKGFVDRLGTPEGALESKTLRKGIQQTEDLSTTLPKYYAPSPEGAAKGAAVAEERQGIEALLSEGETGLEASRKLKAIAKESPATGGGIRRIGAYERMKDKFAESPTGQGLKRFGAESAKTPGRPAGAMVAEQGLEFAREELPAVAGAFDTVAETLRTAPDKLGAWENDIMQAAAMGDDALVAKHYELSEDSPAYRNYMQGLADNQDVRPKKRGKRAYSGTFDNQ